VKKILHPILVNVECDATHQLKSISTHLYCRQRSRTFARLPPEYLVGGFVRYVSQHYPPSSDSMQTKKEEEEVVETILVTTTLGDFYRILETVQSCGSPEDRRLFHSYFSRWADLSSLLRRKMFGMNTVKAGSDSQVFLSELAGHMRLTSADPLCVVHKAFGQFFPLTQSAPPADIQLRNAEELEMHLEPVGHVNLDSSASSYSIVLLHVSLIKTVVEYCGKSFPTLGAIACMESVTRNAELILVDPAARKEGKTELNSAAKAGFAVQRALVRGKLRESLVWEDGKRQLLTESEALQVLMSVLREAAIGVTGDDSADSGSRQG
jgi:hypothetical protein